MCTCLKYIVARINHFQAFEKVEQININAKLKRTDHYEQMYRGGTVHLNFF